MLEILFDEEPTLETNYFIFKYILYINSNIQNILKSNNACSFSWFMSRKYQYKFGEKSGKQCVIAMYIILTYY